jgi:hypothetical protein
LFHRKVDSSQKNNTGKKKENLPGMEGLKKEKGKGKVCMWKTTRWREE